MNAGNQTGSQTGSQLRMAAVGALALAVVLVVIPATQGDLGAVRLLGAVLVGLAAAPFWWGAAASRPAGDDTGSLRRELLGFALGVLLLAVGLLSLKL